LPPAIVDDLLRTTEGNPLFVGETVALLAARGELERRSDAAPAIPGGVEDVIRGRLARLSPAARRALQIASVLGREHDARLAATLIASHGIGDAEAALDEAEKLGFLGRAATACACRTRLCATRSTNRCPCASAARFTSPPRSFTRRRPDADDAGFEAAHHALLRCPKEARRAPSRWLRERRRRWPGGSRSRPRPRCTSARCARCRGPARSAARAAI
jgi:hypothetical protein